MAQRVDRCIAVLFHDRGTRRGWVASSTTRLHFTPRKDSVPILQEAGWAAGSVWTGGKFRPHRDSIPNLPARSSVAIPTELPDPLSSKRTKFSSSNMIFSIVTWSLFFINSKKSSASYALNCGLYIIWWVWGQNNISDEQ